jgi:TolB protein
MNLDTNQRERLGRFPGMTFAPQFAPGGNAVIFSLSQDGNTDIWVMDLGSRQRRRLTRSAAIETSPSYSPDGSQIVFESDRSRRQQLYVMSAGGGEGQRISFGSGSYATPVWSPKGDLIAFTKITGGRLYIGVMRPDGSDERLLDAGFNVEGPTFSPNGRVLMYFSESPGANGQSQLLSIDVSGRNKRRVDTPGPASDPAWSPLREVKQAPGE